MKIGYIWISSYEQDKALQALQVDALKEVGCEKLFTDKSTESVFERNGLEMALLHVHSGDILVVWQLDRLGYSLSHLIEVLNLLKEREVHFVSLVEKIDTTENEGRLFFSFMEVLVKFERDLIRGRTNMGLAEARARGRKGGRPRTLQTNGKVVLAQGLYTDKNVSIQEICSLLGISRATFYRSVGKTGEDDRSNAGERLRS